MQKQDEKEIEDVWTQMAYREESLEFEESKREFGFEFLIENSCFNNIVR